MLRSKIVKQALQQGFSSRSRWLVQILGLNKIQTDGQIGYLKAAKLMAFVLKANSENGSKL
jgi:hypothetical protein